MSLRVLRIGFAALILTGVGTLALLVGTHWPAKPVQAASTADSPHVEGRRILFSEEYARRLHMAFYEIHDATVLPSFQVVGTIAFDPQYVARVGTRLKGLVRKVTRYEGTRVQAGEILATIDSPELGQAQADVSVLQAEHEAAQHTFAREEELAEHQLTTARELEEAQSASKRTAALLAAARQRVTALDGRKPKLGGGSMGTHVLSSPIGGTVVERHISEGQLVPANYEAYVVADLDHLWAELAVFERNLPLVKVGDQVELAAQSSSGTYGVEGTVVQVAPTLDPETREATVRVRLDNRGRHFIPGQSITAKISASSEEAMKRPTIPSRAVIYVDGEPSVFVADGTNGVVVTGVGLGVANGGQVQIITGLASGQRILVQGATELRQEIFR